MTPEERESRRMRQRLYNTFPKRKQAMKMTKKRIKEAQKHTLHKDSIAMENPMYIPEFVRPHGTTPSTNEWLVPEVSTTSGYIPPDSVEMDEDGCSDVLPCHRRRVPSGGRQILLAHQNMLFEECIGGKQKNTTKQSE